MTKEQRIHHLFNSLYRALWTYGDVDNVPPKSDELIDLSNCVDGLHHDFAIICENREALDDRPANETIKQAP